MDVSQSKSIADSLKTLSDAGVPAPRQREAAATRPIFLHCFDSETYPFEAKVPHKKRSSAAHVSQAKGGKKRHKKHTGRPNRIETKTCFWF